MAAFATRGDAAAFDALVGRYLGRGVSVARCLLPSGLAAEDAVQEAFLLVVRHRKRYRRGKSFSPWFYAILRNVCRGMCRGLGRQMKLLNQAAQRLRVESSGTPGPELPSLSELLAGLDEADRAVLTLRVVDGLGFEEIASALGIGHEAAKKRAQRALRRLREGTAGPGGEIKEFPPQASPDRRGRNSEGQE
ncbi:MAG: sigma-70 family RNA polymerase sigma factor [Planctomycetota bacterium]|nr:sigma-70 family RNA polymerase sigma factor [Planctomycetota bacterium]